MHITGGRVVSQLESEIYSIYDQVIHRSESHIEQPHCEQQIIGGPNWTPMEATRPSDYRPDMCDSGVAVCAAESFDRSCARAGLVGRGFAYRFYSKRHVETHI
jgi:hypothetical protein